MKFMDVLVHGHGKFLGNFWKILDNFWKKVQVNLEEISGH